MLRTCGRESKLVEVPGLAMNDLERQAAKFDPIVLTQDIAILEELRRQIRTSQAGRALLDATLVRLALAEQFNQIGDLLAGGMTATAGGAVKKKYVEPVEAKDEGASVKDEVQSLHPSSLIPPPPSSDDDDDALPAVGKVWDNSGPSLSELLKQQQAAHVQHVETASEQSPPVAEASEPSNIEPVGVEDLPALWQKLLDVLAARGASLHSLIMHGKLTAIEDGRAVISYGKKHETFVKMLDRNGKKDVVREALTQITGRPLGVRFDVDLSSPGEAEAPPAAAALESPASRAPARREMARVPWKRRP